MSKKTTKPGDVAVNVDESNGKAKKDGKAKGRCSRILGKPSPPAVPAIPPATFPNMVYTKFALGVHI